MPASPQDRSLVHGKVVETHDQLLVLNVLGTDYRLHLAVPTDFTAEAGHRIAGHIYARAKRVDVVRTGGRFIEPVYGRPRRLQGRIIAIDAAANTITVYCGCPFICELTANQRARDLAVGQLVSFDIERGSRFEMVPLEPVEDEVTDALSSEAASVLPPGHDPTEGAQTSTDQRTPGDKTTDHGALTTDRDVSGQDKPPADFPISG